LVLSWLDYGNGRTQTSYLGLPAFLSDDFSSVGPVTDSLFVPRSPRLSCRWCSYL